MRGGLGQGFRYRAFISYSHHDSQWADWLLKSLESYRIPKRLVGQEGRDGPIAAKLYPVFRDRDELPASADLSERILEALQSSACQIVICSPHAASSRWVNEEIVAFKRLGREDRVLALIVDGQPNAADDDEECFPQALRFRIGPAGALSSVATEPIAADVRPEGDGKTNAKLKLISGLLGIDYAALKRRDEQAMRRRSRIYQTIAASMALLAILAAAAGIFAFQKQREAEYQRDQTYQAQSRALTQTAAVTLKDGEIATALSILRVVLGRQKPGARIDPHALSTFCEAQALDVQLSILSGHMGAVNAARYAPDGTHIVTASDDNTARIWDATTGAEVLRLSGHSALVLLAVYSPDGKRIVTASQDGTARIWDAATGVRLKILAGHRDRVSFASYSPDGKHIVTASSDGTARIWDGKTGNQLVRLVGHTDSVFSAAYSPDGKRIVTGSYDRTARVWDSATGTQMLRLAGHSDGVSSALFSPDGKHIVTASDDNTARVWDAITGRELLRIPGRSAVTSAAYSPDGKRIVASYADGTARVWEAARGAQVLLLSGHAAAVISAAYSPDGKHIATASADKTVRIWDAVTGAQLALFSGHSAGIASVAYSPNGWHVVTASVDKTVRVWDGRTEPLDVQIGYVEAAEFDPLSPAQRFQLGLPEPLPARTAIPAQAAQIGEIAAQTATLEAASATTPTGLSTGSLLRIFRGYAAAAEYAQQHRWPDGVWRTWRHRRASIARLMARAGMTRQVVENYRRAVLAP